MWLAIVTALLIAVLLVPVSMPVAARAFILSIPAFLVGCLGFMGESPGYGRVPTDQRATVHALVQDALGGLLLVGLWLFGFAMAVALASLVKIAVRRVRA